MWKSGKPCLKVARDEKLVFIECVGHHEGKPGVLIHGKGGREGLGAVHAPKGYINNLGMAFVRASYMGTAVATKKPGAVV